MKIDWQANLLLHRALTDALGYVRSADRWLDLSGGNFVVKERLAEAEKLISEVRESETTIIWD